MDYKKLALLIEEQKVETYVKAQIYLELRDLIFEDYKEDLIDDYVDHGYKLWQNSQYIQPTFIGVAMNEGLRAVSPEEYANIEDVTVFGFSIHAEGLQ